MGRKSVKDYAREIQTVYRQAREDYTEAAADLEALVKMKNRVQHDNTLSDIGKREKEATLNHDIAAARERMQAVSDKANERFTAIRNSCETMFKDYYAADPAQVDGNALALLNSGILSNAEIMQLATDKFSTNRTMQRLLAAEAEKRAATTTFDNGGRELLEFAQSITEDSNPHLTALDNVIAWSQHGLNPTNSLLAGAYDGHYAENTQQYIDSAPALCCEWETGGVNPVYSLGD